MARVAWIFAALVTAFSPALAKGQHDRRSPVHVTARPLFGDGFLVPGECTALLVRAENRSTRALHGQIVARIESWERVTPHILPLDLPPRSSRSAVMSVAVPSSLNRITVAFEMDGQTMDPQTVSAGISLGQTVVVLGDAMQLRGALAGLQVTTANPNDAHVGIVPMEPASGDPILPRQSVDWASVDLLLASAPTLARVTGPERDALLNWLHAGGRLLIFLRSPADLRDASLRSLVGEVRVGEGVVTGPLVPPGAHVALNGDPPIFVESFGVSVRVGFGHVFIASFDGTASPSAFAPETRELIRAILGQTLVPGIDVPINALGVGAESAGETVFHPPIRRFLTCGLRSTRTKAIGPVSSPWRSCCCFM